MMLSSSRNSVPFPCWWLISLLWSQTDGLKLGFSSGKAQATLCSFLFFNTFNSSCCILWDLPPLMDSKLCIWWGCSFVSTTVRCPKFYWQKTWDFSVTGERFCCSWGTCKIWDIPWEHFSSCGNLPVAQRNKTWSMYLPPPYVLQYEMFLPHMLELLLLLSITKLAYAITVPVTYLFFFNLFLITTGQKYYAYFSSTYTEKKKRTKYFYKTES